MDIQKYNTNPRQLMRNLEEDRVRRQEKDLAKRWEAFILSAIVVLVVTGILVLGICIEGMSERLLREKPTPQRISTPAHQQTMASPQNGGHDFI